MYCSRLRLLFLWAPFMSMMGLFSGCRTTAGGGRTALPVRIEKGDTPLGIAQKYDTTLAKILRLNGLKSSRDLFIGQVIRVEPGPQGFLIGEETQGQTRAKSLPTAPKKDGLSGAPGTEIAKPEEFTEEDFSKVEPKGASKSQDAGKGAQEGFLFGTPKGARFKGRQGASIRLAWPVRGPLASVFGKRGSRFHDGIDIGSPRGAAVLPAAPGTVVFAGEKAGYGQVIILDHKSFRTLYAHLSTVSVDRGAAVEAQTILGEVGDSGNASGPHLHFEVRAKDGRSIDPMQVLRPLQEVALVF